MTRRFLGSDSWWIGSVIDRVLDLQYRPVSNDDGQSSNGIENNPCGAQAGAPMSGLDNTARPFRLRTSLYVLGAIAITSVMFYTLDRSNVFTYSPWHHDDYRELYRDYGYWPTLQDARPVTQFVYHWLANAGPLFFYLALHALLAADLALIFLLAINLFDPDRMSFRAARWAFLFGTAAVCSSPDLPSIVKYTGNIDHLLSLLFGIPCALFLSRSRKTGSVALIVGSVALFVLSALSKEDTLPFLGIAALFYGIPALRSDHRWPYKAGLIAAGVVSLGIMAFLALHPAAGNAWAVMKHTFQADTHAYAIHREPDELATVVRFLVWPSAYYKLVHLAFLTLVLIHVVALRKATALKALLIGAALLTPYALLGPNHVYGYYRFNFSPFAVYCAFIMGIELAALLRAHRSMRPEWKSAAFGLWAAAWIATAGALFQTGKAERQAILAWHNNLQGISRKVLGELTELAPTLRKYPEVHVMGADTPINPFFWQESVVYIDREILQAPVRWVIHYRNGSELHERLQGYRWNTEDPVITYVASEAAGPAAEVPRIEVDSSFNTRFVPGR
ncbi:MAG TPA: hypothetical protein VFY29_09060 [Terriglobia bacterium]|nr:hypothetical protein [Terriglobia bacterium]